MIAVPKEWAEQYGYKPGDEIPYLANRDLVLLSPQSNAEYYQTGTDLVRKSREEAAAHEEESKAEKKKEEASAEGDSTGIGEG